MLETAGTTGAIETTLATKTLLRDGTQVGDGAKGKRVGRWLQS
jgi:hypothetical protein